MAVKNMSIEAAVFSFILLSSVRSFAFNLDIAREYTALKNKGLYENSAAEKRLFGCCLE